MYYNSMVNKEFKKKKCLLPKAGNKQQSKERRRHEFGVRVDTNLIFFSFDKKERDVRIGR